MKIKSGETKNSSENKILFDILWIFRPKKYESRENFNQAIRQHQIDITENDTWQPDKIVIKKPQINVLLEMDWEIPPDDQVEFLIKSENSISFTASDLMFQINNHLAEYDLGDYKFFEGLNFNREKNLYVINLGS